MIIDTSAIVAILTNEPNREPFEVAIADTNCAMSSVTLLETSIVLLTRKGEESLAGLDAWVESAEILVEPFTAAQARLARNAYARFGKGQHPAGLNFGDCASYALAIHRNEELLYQGNNFALTDVRTAIPTARPDK